MFSIIWIYQMEKMLVWKERSRSKLLVVVVIRLSQTVIYVA